MPDNELLLSVSNLMDIKLEPISKNIECVKQDIAGVKQDMEEGYQQNILTIAKDIEEKLKLLVDNWIPFLKRFNNACDQIEVMQADINIIKEVTAEHSKQIEQLEKIS